ncbi:MAG: LPS translocon maturation chaperone LptM [Alteromonas sp.]
MKKSRYLAIAAATCVFLSACGYRGPLYLPQDPPQNTEQETQESEQTDTQREEQ